MFCKIEKRIPVLAKYIQVFKELDTKSCWLQHNLLNYGFDYAETEVGPVEENMVTNSMKVKQLKY